MRFANRRHGEALREEAVRNLADLERAVTSGAVAGSAHGLAAHKAETRAASKEAPASKLSDASNPRRGMRTPAPPAPYRERGRHLELDAPEGGYITSPFGNTAPLSYGVGGTGRWF
jgi:hypothetical protein